jgi:ADP-heptose:LPS heptosyltransferase
VPQKVRWDDLRELTGWQSTGEFVRADQIFRQINVRLADRLPAGSDVVVVRDQGLGDVLMASVAVRALARARPQLHVSFFTEKRYAPLFNGPWEAHGVGFLEEVRGRFQNAFDQRGLVERDGRKHVEDRKRIFCRNLGVPFPSPLDPPVFVSHEAEAQASALLGPLLRFPVALICPESSGGPRSFSEPLVNRLAKLAHARRMVPVVVGQREAKREGVLDLTGRTDVPTLAALVKRAAIVYATDSGPMHLAGMLERPCVALFNEVDPALRCEGYGTVIPITVSGVIDGIDMETLKAATDEAVGIPVTIAA